MNCASNKCAGSTLKAVLPYFRPSKELMLNALLTRRHQYISRRASSCQRMTKLMCGLEIAPTSTETSCKSLSLMLHCGIIQASHPGAYHLLPLGTTALEKLSCLIDEAMQRCCAQKVVLPLMTTENLWKASGRWTSTGPELFTMSDRHAVKYCLSPTHEESVTSLLAAHRPLSYRRLPLRLYQIGKKFRDEMHPKHGLLRAREFDMKDLYTFDASLDSARDTYEAVTEAYHWLFHQLRVPYCRVEGSVGNIGGHLSHEFHVPADVGEDSLLVCSECNRGCNCELASGPDDVLGVETFRSCEKHPCPIQKSTVSGIEVAHTFLLGQKYSKQFRALIIGPDQQEHVTEMGCFGIGVSRLMAASIEALSRDKFIRWPKKIAPLQVVVIPQKEGYRYAETFAMSEALCEEVIKRIPSREAALDDCTWNSIGKRLYSANKIGVPFALAVGKGALESPPQIELHDLYSGQRWDCEPQEAVSRLFNLLSEEQGFSSS